MNREYIHVYNYKDYETLRNWCLKYYPELLEMQDMTKLQYLSTENKFKRARNAEAKKKLDEYKREWERVSIELSGTTVNEYTPEYLNELEKNASKTISQVVLETSLPVFATTKETRKILKWRCPLLFVRIFLYKDWNVRDKFFYRWVWLGKKEFLEN